VRRVFLVCEDCWDICSFTAYFDRGPINYVLLVLSSIL
jgi:hypothetical protein